MDKYFPLYDPSLPQSITAFGRKLMKIKLIDITAELCHETDKAYLVYDGRSEIKKGNIVPSKIKTWIPKAMVEYDDRKTFTMPEWLALEKGFI